MANFQFITPHLATGGDLPYDPETDAPALAALAEWVELGITHIVDNRIEADDIELVAEHAPHIAYLYNGVDDRGQRMPDSWFETALAFVTEALKDPNAKVLVHCHMGINRGPSLAFAMLLAQGWDPVEALAAIRKVRPIAGMSYSEDALVWHLRRTGATRDEVVAALANVRRWHEDNWIDTVRIIAAVRAGEAA